MSSLRFTKVSPSRLGRFFTRSPAWRLSPFLETAATLAIEENFYIASLNDIRVVPGLFWTSIDFRTQQGELVTVDGLPNYHAAPLINSVNEAVLRKGQQEHRLAVQAELERRLAPVVAWSQAVEKAAKRQIASKGWLTSEFIKQHSSNKPIGVDALLRSEDVQKHCQLILDEHKEDINRWKKDLGEMTARANAEQEEKAARQSKTFFDSVEKSPLSAEQIKAVVCFDNRVQLVASAGSGKTSTMVAKAGYALKMGYFAPEQIILLAFNNDAAAELGERLHSRLTPLGLAAEKVAAKTFHAFGLSIIGQATGRKPSLAPWVEDNRDVEQLLTIVDDLKDKDASFRSQWDLFRIVLGQDLPKFGEEFDAPDSYDKSSKRRGFRTLKNEIVKSRGEQIIANWLFYNGVKYEYEKPYAIDTANELYRAYHPDFYIVDADAYLEHWALDEFGEPPASFIGYKEGILWKRQLHQEHGTTLLETTMASLWSGKAFSYLQAQLSVLGISLNPDPTREIPGRKAIENERLARTFRSFITHAKSNRIDVAGLKIRLQQNGAGHFLYRHTVFLGLTEKIWEEWEARLKAAKCIDFEDMLNIAIDCVEQGRWKSPYELVMVDEFQDASQGRARLISGLLASTGKHLFAVGDDWQSINRFAGADLSVMTDFEKKFGKGVVLKLETTFRCPQSLCDISSAFVQQNPSQLKKVVRSSRPNVPMPVRIFRVEEEAEIVAALRFRLDEITRRAPAGSTPTVMVLGRYQRDRAFMVNSAPGLIMEFMTIHASKGMEADHIIIPRITSETLGFPSQIADDPVLQLAMPQAEGFGNAEERRLFYVALTRARSTVTLITIANKESEFVSELVKTHKIPVRNSDGTLSKSALCKVCSKGFMVPRTGPFGPFMGCTEYPGCTNTSAVEKDRDESAANLEALFGQEDAEVPEPDTLTAHLEKAIGERSYAPLKGRLSLSELFGAHAGKNRSN